MGEAAPGDRPANDGRPETELERWDRNFTELLQELRVAQTGVQILFGFLLTVPFSIRFEKATVLQVSVYTLTVLACALAAALLIAPVSHHRHAFRQGRKRELVRIADQFARAGLVALLVAMAGVVFLLLDVIQGIALAAPMTVVVVLVYVELWYRRPRLAMRHEARSATTDGAGGAGGTGTRGGTGEAG
ncbi:MAG: DUF6328 family protein [Actinocrinis sp.]